MSRRRLLAGLSAGSAAMVLSACTTTRARQEAPEPEPLPEPLGYQEMYGPVFDAGYEIPGIPEGRVDPRFLRQVVPDPTGEIPGTIVIDTASHYLYHVQPNRRAMRYGVGLGRAGFEWSGRAEIEWKQPWPRWFPPEDMIDRDPRLEPYRAEYNPQTGIWEGGQEPGLRNPLGARALYIYEDGVDTLYRIHGSPEWWSIGMSVSSGCVRMINQDAIHLYDRVEPGAPVLVTSGLLSV